MALSPETIKLRQEREAQSKEPHNPTPEQKAEEAQYWRENVELRAELDKARMAQAAKLERLRKGQRPAADPKDRTLKDILMDLRPDQRPQVLRIAKALHLAKKKRKHMH